MTRAGTRDRWIVRRPNPVFSPEYRALVGVLTAARQEGGLSQAALALRLGRAKSHISRIEQGQRRVDSLELVRIAYALRMAPEELFTRILDALREAGLPESATPLPRPSQ